MLRKVPKKCPHCKSDDVGTTKKGLYCVCFDCNKMIGQMKNIGGKKSLVDPDLISSLPANGRL
jgi:hypothetical protein